jgi:hypothetical protein
MHFILSEAIDLGTTGFNMEHLPIFSNTQCTASCSVLHVYEAWELPHLKSGVTLLSCWDQGL